MSRTHLTLAALVLATSASVSGQTAADQIALAVMPLPEHERAGATVLGFEGTDNMVTLREGNGDFICLADYPGDQRFQVACYHTSLEPYMARGRALRGEGLQGPANIERRWEEIEAGTLSMPRQATALYQLIGRDVTVVRPGSMEGLQRLTVIYMAYATAEETGFPARPVEGLPWMMYSGKPTAHLMISN